MKWFSDLLFKVNYKVERSVGKFDLVLDWYICYIKNFVILFCFFKWINKYMM